MGRVIFLGTGDPFNYERAQTVLAVPLAGGETMLLDTSSGTVLLRQLHDAGIPFESVRHLLISHRHFDHAGGLAPFLAGIVPLAGANVTVHALPGTLRSLRDLLELTIPGVEEWLGPRLSWNALKADETLDVGGVGVTPFRVEHGLECIGFHLAQDGTAAVFSADTKPCRSIVQYAGKAGLLIHEAYGLESEAESIHLYGHSTAADAGKAARAAGVPRLILTHVRASEFVDPEALRDEAEAFFGAPVELAHDLGETEF